MRTALRRLILVALALFAPIRVLHANETPGMAQHAFATVIDHRFSPSHRGAKFALELGRLHALLRSTPPRHAAREFCCMLAAEAPEVDEISIPETPEPEAAAPAPKPASLAPHHAESAIET